MSTSMPETLAGASIDAAVHQAHPDYVAVLMAASELEPGPPTEHSEALLCRAEAHARRLLAGCEPHDLPEVLAWRQAYAGFGVKPREARSSLEALLRRRQYASRGRGASGPPGPSADCYAPRRWARCDRRAA